MAEKILKRCVIVCASPDADADYIKEKIRPDDYIIAADGGMRALGAVDIVPDLFIGDFDSFGEAVPEGVEIIKLNTHKDDTDSMHCAVEALERGFTNVVLLGASGGSPSHTFSNYSVLSLLSCGGADAVMEDKDENVRILTEGCHSFNDYKDCGFSVFPFGCGSVTVTYSGEAEYPATDLIIPDDLSIGKSNVIRSDEFEIIVKSGKAIVFYCDPSR